MTNRNAYSASSIDRQVFSMREAQATEERTLELGIKLTDAIASQTQSCHEWSYQSSPEIHSVP